MRRRDFLALSTIFGASAASGVSFWGTRAQAALNSPRLVFVFLRGGADALSLVAPRGAAFTTLQGYRPTIAMQNPTAFGPDLNLHPAMSPLLAPGIVSNLNFVLHAGSTVDNRSHFDQQTRIESGDGAGVATTGFLGRTATALAVRAGTVSRSVPASLRGFDALVLNDPARVQAGYASGPLKPGWSRSQRLAGFKVAAGETGNATMDAIARKAEVDGNALAAELAGETIATLTANHGYVTSTVYGQPSFAQNLAVAARLCTTSIDPRIVTVDGTQFWDTHANQRTNDATSYQTMYKSIASLAYNLAAFKGDLVARGVWNSTVVVVMSEFGRGVKENGAFGTDHGRGGMMMLMGGRVRPHADPAYVGTRQWSLPIAPDATSALAVTHDYRIVLAEIMERHLGMPRAQVASIFLNQVTLGSYLNVLV